MSTFMSLTLSLSLLLGLARPSVAMAYQDVPATEQKQEAPKTETEKKADEKQRQQKLVQALRKEAATTFAKLEDCLTKLEAAGKELKEATQADREAKTNHVEVLTKERDKLVSSLQGLVVSLEEKGEEMKQERGLLIKILGEKGKKPEKIVTEEELVQELDKLSKDEIFAKMGIEYAKYKGTIEAVTAAEEKLAELAAGDQTRAGKKKQLDEAKAESQKSAERLQSYVTVYKAKGGKGETLTEIEKLLFTNQGGTLENLSGEVAVSLVTEWLDSAWTSIKTATPGLIWALVKFLLILFVFGIIARICARIVGRAFKTKRLRKSDLLADFATRTTKNLVMLIGLLIAVEKLGLDTTPLIAGIGAAGLVIGLALQGTLSNFASGIMLLFYRPYDVGDVVSVGSVTGKVESMNLVSTTVLTADNQLVIVPNNSIWGNVITNITAKKERRVDLVFGIGYGDDIAHAEKILSEIVTQHPKVLPEPAPTIKVGTLNSSSVDFICRPWCRTSDYWNVYWDLTRTVKLRFDEEGISIPFPQQDIHIHQEPAADSEPIKTIQPAPRVEKPARVEPAQQQLDD